MIDQTRRSAGREVPSTEKKLNFQRKTYLILGAASVFFLVVLYPVSIGKKSFFLTPEETAWLDANRESLTFTPDPAFEPFEFFDAKGEYKGIAADIYHEIRNLTGRVFNVKKLADWNNVIKELEAGKSAGVFAIVETEKRNEYLFFTKPFMKVPLVIISREKGLALRDLKETAFEKIVITDGYIYTEYLESIYPETGFIRAESDLEGLKMVSYSEADAMIINLASASWHITESSLVNLFISGDVDYLMPLSIGISRQYPELYTMVSRALDSLPKTKFERIFNKWIDLRYPWYRRYPLLFYMTVSSIILLAVAFTAIVSMAAINRFLKKSVDEKTKMLEASHEFMRAIIDVIPDPILVKDSSHIYTLVNSSLAKLLGKSKEEIIGKKADDIFPQEAARFDKADHQVLSDSSILSYEYQLPDAEGENHVFLTKKTVFEDYTGNKSILVIMSDITEVREREKELLQAQKLEAVGRLASGLAHDFNNALMGIEGSASLMEHSAMEAPSVTSSELLGYLKVLKQSSFRAGEIVQRLLSVSKKSDIRYTHLDAELPVRNIYQTVRHSFDKRVAVRLEIKSKDNFINGDISQIEQCVLNLMLNSYHAVTFMRGSFEEWGGEIKLTLEKSVIDKLPSTADRDASPGSYCCISVTDNGVGIDKSKIDSIFRPFYSTKKDRGSGLGLSMANEITRQHGGFMTMESEKGIGSCFSIYLPLLEKAPEVVEKNEKTVSRGEGLVLVIDDDESVRETASRMLEVSGYTVAAAEDGKAGLDYLGNASRKPSLVVLDFMMPGLPSVSVFREIRKKWPEIKVLLVSGYGQDEGVLAMIDEGVDSFLQKPFSLRELSEAVSSLLKKQ